MKFSQKWFLCHAERCVVSIYDRFCNAGMYAYQMMCHQRTLLIFISAQNSSKLMALEVMSV